MNMIKNLLLLGFFASLSFAVKADINYVNYGDGLVIGMSENYEMDINQDGVKDFLINTQPNELDFTPIFTVGCFPSTGWTEETPWGTRELRIFEKEDYINMTDANMGDYIEDGRGGVYSQGFGLANGWVDEEDVYIGFGVFSPDLTTVSNGWIKVIPDVENETLIIKEMAYTDFAEVGETGIIVGDTGVSSLTEVDNLINDLSITPNPANDIAALNFKYPRNTSINLDIFTIDGQQILNQKVNITSGDNNLSLNISEWDSGVYFIRLKTIRGIRTQRLLVSH